MPILRVRHPVDRRSIPLDWLAISENRQDEFSGRRFLNDAVDDGAVLGCLVLNEHVAKCLVVPASVTLCRSR